MALSVSDDHYQEYFVCWCLSGQAYVGAFLRMSAVSPQGIEGVLQSETSPSEVSASVEANDAELQSVGTFCQVHHISEMESGNAQMLLLGHRRLKRLHKVSSVPVLATYRFARSIVSLTNASIPWNVGHARANFLLGNAT